MREKEWADKEPADVLKAIEDAGMTPFSHFEVHGNAEWVSPSPLFDNSYYLACKVNQLNPIREGGRNDRTMQQVIDAFKAAGLSPWDHYTQHGIAEGIDPSAEFDTSAYMEAKLIQLNKTEKDAGWTMDTVKPIPKTLSSKTALPVWLLLVPM